MYSQILYCVLEGYTLSHNLKLNGKINGSGSRVLTNTENWIESMENLWNSSGKFHRIHHVADSRRGPKNDE